MLSLVKLETTMFLLPFWLKICEETTIVGVQAGMFFYVSLRVIKKFRIEVIKFSPSNDNRSLDQNIPWYFVALINDF